MFKHAETQQTHSAGQCPICGNTFPLLPPSPQFDAPCAGCGGYLWCSMHRHKRIVVLEAMPDRTPATCDVEQVVDGVLKTGSVRRVVFDLSRLSHISSALVARLVVLNRRFKAAGCELVLCGMNSVVRETFDTFKLFRAFTVVDNRQTAMEDESPGMPG